MRAIDALTRNALVTNTSSRPVDLFGHGCAGYVPYVAVLDQGRVCGVVDVSKLRALDWEREFSAFAREHTTLSISAEAPLEEAIRALTQAADSIAAVVNTSGQYLGMVTLDEMLPRLVERCARNARTSSDSLLAALENSVIVAVTDTAGIITEANSAFCEISGYSREELIGANHRLLNSSHHSKAFWVQMWRIIAKGGIWRAEVCNRAKDGTLYWVDTTIAPIRSMSGRIEGYIAIRIDITARKHGEEKLTHALRTAEAASRAKSEFLANMSHEIRTPMMAILGFTEVLHESGDLHMAPPQRLKDIETIRSAGQHLMTVINDILDVSKLEAGEMKVECVESSIVSALVDVEQIVKPRAAEKGLSLQVRLETPVPDKIMIDPVRLRQILLNLVGNAIKFTESGRVNVSTRCESKHDAKSLIIEVEDTGSGMIAEQTSRLFVPFGQADSTMTRRFGGSGLGLTICRRLARLMGGDVTLTRTARDKGSCFRFEVPCEAAPGSGMVATLGWPQERPGNTIVAPLTLKGRILFAEDGIDNQRVISFHLRKAGAEVCIADNGRIALEMIEGAAAEGRPFDLLVTDMQMPEMDGYTLARTLRTRQPRRPGERFMPVIALTAHALAEDRERCLEAGCDDYAAKPIEKARLLEICATWIGKRTGSAAEKNAA